MLSEFKFFLWISSRSPSPEQWYYGVIDLEVKFLKFLQLVSRKLNISVEKYNAGWTFSVVALLLFAKMVDFSAHIAAIVRKSDELQENEYRRSFAEKCRYCCRDFKKGSAKLWEHSPTVSSEDVISEKSTRETWVNENKTSIDRMHFLTFKTAKVIIMKWSLETSKIQLSVEKL